VGLIDPIVLCWGLCSSLPHQQALAWVPRGPVLTRPPCARAAAAKRAFNLPPHETIFRLVVNVVDTALIIGRGGATVRQIEQDSGARAPVPAAPAGRSWPPPSLPCHAVRAM
jgi:hypothetical protein